MPEAVDAVGRAVGKCRIVLERPALFAQARNGDGDADDAGELLESEKNLCAVRPRAGIGDIEVIASGLGRKAGRTVGRDAVAEHAVHALEIAGLADLVDRIFVAPLAVDQHTHYAASPRTSAAAWRIAAMFARYDSGVRSLNTAEPATSALAPARTTSAATCGVMPPSISMSIGRPPASARSLRSLSIAAGMNFWPPKPGLTDMTRMRSTRSMTGSTASAGVPGLVVTPAFLPSARIACSERWICGPASTCTVMMSEPALANASR